jgi:hypothetical protein
MALIVLASANGSPGVTTTSLAMAMAWPRPTLLIEADPTGASAFGSGWFAGHFQPEATIVDLALANRQGTLEDELPKLVTTIPGTHINFLPGALRHSQTGSLEHLWEPLSAVLRGLDRNGMDVIVDAGRLGLNGSPTKLVAAADLALLLTRNNLPSLVAAAAWAPTLRDMFATAGAHQSLAAVMVDAGRRAHPVRDAANVLQIPYLSTIIAWDPQSSAVYSLGDTPHRKFANSAYMRSIQALTQSIQFTISASRNQLGLTDEAEEATQ